MIPWELLDRALVPVSGEELLLYRHGEDFSIRVNGNELMNSRVHGSEEVLAERACEAIAGYPCPQVLIGGLGMGYTAAAALRRLGVDSRIVVAEIMPAVVTWNRGPLAELAGRPLDDPRVLLQEVDIVRILKEERQSYNAIILDVDNGPKGLTRKDNNWLYTPAGLNAAFKALRPKGVLAVWSADSERTFTHRLNQAGFKVREEGVRARIIGKGSHHTIWLAVRGF